MRPATWNAFCAMEADPEVRHFVASVEVGNAAPVRVLEKLGFHCIRLESVGHRSFNHYELRGDHP